VIFSGVGKGAVRGQTEEVGWVWLGNQIEWNGYVLFFKWNDFISYLVVRTEPLRFLLGSWNVSGAILIDV
jgi:hypothetical protein